MSLFDHFSPRLAEITLIITRPLLLRVRNISDKGYLGSQNTHFIFNKFFLRKSCRLGDNVEKYGTARQATDESIIRRMRIACWFLKVTDTQSEYAILIAVSLQNWLHKHVPAFRYR